MSVNAPKMDMSSYANEFIPPQLAIKAMRDNGFKTTAHALAELIDNSIQAGSDLVTVYCIEEDVNIVKKTSRRMSRIGILDNGHGMDGGTLRSALQFGNGTHLNDRSGIGRFGMGLPNSSISQCSRVDVWTWQSGPSNALHTYMDIKDIMTGKTREVPVPEAEAVPEHWMKRSGGSLDSSGTLVVWSGFEDNRLTWKRARATLKNTETMIGRMYRKFISDGIVRIRLVSEAPDGSIDDRDAKANDPLYLIAPSSTPAPFDKEPMFQSRGEDSTFEIEYEGKKGTVHVRASLASSRTWPQDGSNRGSTDYGKHAARNIGVSVVRAGRELELDDAWTIGYNPTERWWGLEVEFPPELDEVFGVTNNKQAATTFAEMAQYDWKTDADDGESLTKFTDRLREEGDIRYLLLPIVNHIADLLRPMREEIKAQGANRRSGKQRHDETSEVDTATTAINRRIKEGYTTTSDDQVYGDDEQEQLEQDLKDKDVGDEDARAIALAVRQLGRKIVFIEAAIAGPAFFDVEVKPGNVTEVVFNTRHEVHEQLIELLNTDVTGCSDAELMSRIENASATLKLLFAAWARYEEETPQRRDALEEARCDWGKMAKYFLKNPN
jgi:hypothetical protein